MDDAVLIDLFGNAVRMTRRGRGRPAHIATPENRQKVVLLLAVGHSDEDIADALGVCTKTLFSKYKHELSYRRTARMLLDAKNLTAIVEQVEKGNAAAMSLLDKKIERWRIGATGKPDRAIKAPKLGKKEQQLIDARNAGADSSWDTLLTTH